MNASFKIIMTHNYNLIFLLFPLFFLVKLGMYYYSKRITRKKLNQGRFCQGHNDDEICNVNFLSMN